MRPQPASAGGNRGSGLRPPYLSTGHQQHLNTRRSLCPAINPRSRYRPAAFPKPGRLTVERRARYIGEWLKTEARYLAS